MKLFKHYPTVVRLKSFSTIQHFTNDAANAEAMVREGEFFSKRIVFPFAVLKPLGGDGLFTTNADDPKWILAHKLLMPAFAPRAIKAYTSEMIRLAQKLKTVLDDFVDKKMEVDLMTWMTNVTFEAIGMIGFGYSFKVLDSFAAKTSHPFLDAMGYCLGQMMARVITPDFVKRLPTPANVKFEASIGLMQKVVSEVITQRRQHPHGDGDQMDLLDFMLTAADDMGVKMDDHLIRDQVITFLIAGHETTSNTLTWALVLLHEHPSILERCLVEIESIGFGEEGFKPGDVQKLELVERVIKETLRLYPPVQRLVKACMKDCILPSGHRVKKGELGIVSVNGLHFNPDIYPDPEKFDPERWTSDMEATRSAYSWLPFSIGARGCIGRQFAMLEAKIVLATVLKHFHVVIPNGHKIQPIKNGITKRPVPFNARFLKRTPGSSLPPLPKSPTISPGEGGESRPRTRGHSPVRSESLSPTSTVSSPRKTSFRPIVADRIPVTVLYGTNTGTSLDYATHVMALFKDMGFPTQMKNLNDWEVIKTGVSAKKSSDMTELVIVVTATYNGCPPENSDVFDKFLAQCVNKGVSFAGMGFGVFGCGNSEWRTYQAFPRLVDSSFDRLGATRICNPGAGDAHLDGGLDAAFELWIAVLWERVVSHFELEAEAIPTGVEAIVVDDGQLEILSPMAGFASNQNRLRSCNSSILSSTDEQNTAATGRTTRYIRVALPPGDSYLPGDHLEVYPIQTDAIVDQAAAVLGLNLDDGFEVKSLPSRVSNRSVLASIKGPCTLRNAFKYFADLTGSPGRTQLKVLGDALCKDPKRSEEGRKLLAMSSPDGRDLLAAFCQTHHTVVDAFAAYADVAKNLTLMDVLACIGVITPRRYSIASSPTEPGVVSLLVVETADELNGATYRGLASRYVCTLPVGAPVAVAVKPCPTFRLPESASVPLIMIGAGTGLAPLLGFLDHRKAMGVVSTTKGGMSTTQLLFGCRNEDDFLCRQKLEGYVADGTLCGLHVAYSRPADGAKTYVQDVLYANKELLYPLIVDQNAHIYVCGSTSLSRGIKTSLDRIFVENKTAAGYFEAMVKEGRIHEDVWG
ncbi:lanosterol 14-alpha-demethylase [Kappamyces sp. JEL0680]|nr:lanosterol 14-alpha-demethylase [Kappamyces sp. JEL0680]